MKTIITTVGTSLLENYMSREVQQLFKLEGEVYEDISGIFRTLQNSESATDDTQFQAEIGKIKNCIKQLWLTGITKQTDKWKFTDNLEKCNEYASAEIESIIKIQQVVGEMVAVHLISTDTVLSVVAAELIDQFLNDHYSDEIETHFNPQLNVISDLRVDDFSRFKRGLVHLTNRFYQIADNQLLAGLAQDIILNITGGYKGIIPYLSLLGQVNQTRIQYTFEGTGVLINIPQIPIREDDELFAKHWQALRQLENGIFNRFEYAQLYQDLNACFDTDGDDFTFNFLGEALWKKYANQYFIFFAPADTWEEIEHQPDIQRILATKLWRKEVHDSSRVEKKGDKLCYDDGKNNYRIYLLKRNGQLYIYKTFENEEAAKRYISTPINEAQIIATAQPRKILKQNTSS